MVSSELWFFSSWTDVERANLHAATNCSRDALAEPLSAPLQQAAPCQDPGRAQTKSALLMNLFCIAMLNVSVLPHTGHRITALLIWLQRFCQSLPGAQSCFESSKPWLIIPWALRSGSWADGRRGSLTTGYRAKCQPIVATQWLWPRGSSFLCFNIVHIICSPWAGCHMLTKRNKKHKHMTSNPQATFPLKCVYYSIVYQVLLYLIISFISLALQDR